MTRSRRHTPIAKDTDHCGSNKRGKRMANHKVRKYNKLNIDDVRELWMLDNDESIDDDWLPFIGLKEIERNDKHYSRIVDKIRIPPSNKSYKKVFESWDISDYSFWISKDNWKYMRK